MTPWYPLTVAGRLAFWAAQGAWIGWQLSGSAVHLIVHAILKGVCP